MGKKEKKRLNKESHERFEREEKAIKEKCLWCLKRNTDEVKEVQRCKGKIN